MIHYLLIVVIIHGLDTATGNGGYLMVPREQNEYTVHHLFDTRMECMGVGKVAIANAPDRYFTCTEVMQ